MQNSWLIAHRSSLIARKMRPRAPGKTRVARRPIAPRPKEAASARTAVGASTIVRCQARLSEPMPEQAIARSRRPGAPAPRRTVAPRPFPETVTSTIQPRTSADAPL
ncbi:hypothetical protein X941_5588 [Burkholderia pseudomallei MSHR5569]|nr:hypothetical protein X941_5588 [Burkholderia pseudomallei MSHR5569]